MSQIVTHNSSRIIRSTASTKLKIRNWHSRCATDDTNLDNSLDNQSWQATLTTNLDNQSWQQSWKQSWKPILKTNLDKQSWQAILTTNLHSQSWPPILKTNLDKQSWQPMLSGNWWQNLENINYDSGNPLFEMCCFHMGSAQIALDPPSPSSPPFKRAPGSTFFRPYFFISFFTLPKWAKKCTNHPGKCADPP